MTLDNVADTIISMGKNFKTEEDWLRRRLEGLGGTETSAILGHNPYMSAVDLWMEKTTGIARQVNSLAALRGKYLEPMVAELYKEHTGYGVADMSDNISFASLSQPYSLGTLDRIAWDHKGIRVVEIKTVGTRGIDKWIHGVPMMYKIQTMKYVAIVQELIDFAFPNYNNVYSPVVGDVAVFINDDFQLYSGIDCPDRMKEVLFRADEWFWNKKVRLDDPPEPHDLADMRKLWQEQTSKDYLPVDDDAMHAIKVREKCKMLYKSVRDEHMRIENRIKTLQDKCEEVILGKIQEKEGLSCDDEPLITWKQGAKSRSLRTNAIQLKKLFKL